MPALRQTSSAGVPPSARFRTKVICACLNFYAFMDLLVPNGDHKWKTPVLNGLKSRGLRERPPSYLERLKS